MSYICNTYANHGKEVCSSHSILQRNIEGLVLDTIISKTYEERMLGQYRTKMVVQDTYGQTSLTSQIFRQIVQK